MFSLEDTKVYWTFTVPPVNDLIDVLPPEAHPSLFADDLKLRVVNIGFLGNPITGCINPVLNRLSFLSGFHSNKYIAVNQLTII